MTRDNSNEEEEEMKETSNERVSNLLNVKNEKAAPNVVSSNVEVVMMETSEKKTNNDAKEMEASPPSKQTSTPSSSPTPPSSSPTPPSSSPTPPSPPKSSSTILSPSSNNKPSFTSVTSPPSTATSAKSSLSDVLVFVPGSISNFWECPHCQNLPLTSRGRWSVVFSAAHKDDPPSSRNNCLVQKHWKLCRTNKKRPRGNRPSSPPNNSNTNHELNHANPAVSNYNGNIHDTYGMDEESNYDDDNNIDNHKKTRTTTINTNNTAQSVAVVPAATIDDLQFATDYDVHMLSQFEFCLYDNSLDGTHRSGHIRPNGFPGMQCRHCRRKRVFCASIHSFLNNFSVLEHHILKCIHTPKSVKLGVTKAKALRTGQREAIRSKRRMDENSNGNEEVVVEDGEFLTKRAYVELVWKRMNEYSMERNGQCVQEDVTAEEGEF